MQEWIILTPADLEETNWELLSEALRDAPQPQLVLKLWLGVAAKNAQQLDAG